MTRSALRLALPLAGLLFVAPVEARELGHETVGDFVNLPPGAQIMHLDGALEMAMVLGSIGCEMPVTVGQMRDLLLREVQLGRLERNDNFMTAVLLTLIGLGCQAEESGNAGPKVPA